MRNPATGSPSASSRITAIQGAIARARSACVRWSGVTASDSGSPAASASISWSCIGVVVASASTPGPPIFPQTRCDEPHQTCFAKPTVPPDGDHGRPGEHRLQEVYHQAVAGLGLEQGLGLPGGLEWVPGKIIELQPGVAHFAYLIAQEPETKTTKRAWPRVETRLRYGMHGWTPPPGSDGFRTAAEGSIQAVRNREWVVMPRKVPAAPAALSSIAPAGVASTARTAILAATMACAAPLASASATPQQDTAQIVTVQVENDAVSTLQGTSDQYYTSGLRVGWTSGTNQVPEALETASNSLWGDGVQRISLSLSQSLFTPRNTQLSNPPLSDRPYAGVLGLTGSLIHDMDYSRTVVSVFLGVIGPAALGEEVQNGFHNIIGDTPNRGWSTQIHNEGLFEITPERTWRFPFASYQGVSADVLPSVTAGVGLLRNYAQAGLIVRAGQGLDSDYGVARIQPGITGTDAYTPTRPFVWYVFGGADAQAVASDVTLDGDNFESSRHVQKKWDVGELELGAALIYRGVRLTYSQTWQTQEFHGQKGGLFNFGSVAASVRF